MPAAKASIRTIPKLSPASEGAQSTSASCRRRQSSSSRDAAERRRCAARHPGRQIAARPPRGRRRPRSAGRGRARPAPRRRASRTGRPLRSSARPTNRRRSSSAGRLRALAARPRRRRRWGRSGTRRRTSAGRSRRRPRRRRSARAELVEAAARAEQVGDVVGNRLGRVGVEGADDRGAAEGSRRPTRSAGAGGSWTWTTSKRPARSSRRIRAQAVGERARGWRRRRWRRSRSCGRAGSGSRAARGPRRGAVEAAAEAVGRVPGGEHADVVAACRSAAPPSASTCRLTPPDRSRNRGNRAIRMGDYAGDRTDHG